MFAGCGEAIGEYIHSGKNSVALSLIAMADGAARQEGAQLVSLNVGLELHIHAEVPSPDAVQGCFY